MSDKRWITTGSPFETAFGYARAVVQGDWCFVAGVTGYDYATMSLSDDPAVQAETCLKTIRDVLEDAGFTLADVVRVQYTLPDRADVERVQPVLGTAFADIRPAATLVIADLLNVDMKIEIEVTAFRG